MSPGRMRYQMTLLLPGARTAMGAVSATLLEDETFWCDVKERDTSEKETGDRLSQTRAFDVKLRHTTAIEPDAKVRLTFGPESLTCSVVSIVQDSRAGTTKLIAALEA